MKLLYIFLICLSIYYWSTFYETFLVVGHNNSIIPNYTINNLFDKETNILDSEFSNLSLDRNFNIKSFKLYNTNIPFPFTIQFKTLLLEFLKTVPSINKNKITLGNFNNIYYSDNGIFILNVNLQDSTKFTSKNIKVKFLVDEQKSISLLGVILEENNYANFTMNGVDQSDPNFYLITNQLYLMDPFVTSNADMIITKSMKKTFDKSLTEHQQRYSPNLNV